MILRKGSPGSEVWEQLGSTGQLEKDMRAGLRISLRRVKGRRLRVGTKETPGTYCSLFCSFAFGPDNFQTQGTEVEHTNGYDRTIDNAPGLQIEYIKT